MWHQMKRSTLDNLDFSLALRHNARPSYLQAVTIYDVYLLELFGRGRFSRDTLERAIKVC